jgi:hypothetical protein
MIDGLGCVRWRHRDRPIAEPLRISASACKGDSTHERLGPAADVTAGPFTTSCKSSVDRTLTLHGRVIFA